MNQYGRQAMDHWRRWLPSRFAQIEDQDRFFATLGEEVAEQIADQSAELAAQSPAEGAYLDEVGRLNSIRQRVEEQVLQERVLLEPESSDPAAAQEA